MRSHVCARPLRNQTHRELVYRALQFHKRSQQFVPPQPSRLFALSTVFDLHYVCVNSTGAMEHWRLVDGETWTRLATFGTGVSSAPCMIVSQAGIQ
jgi:hypothetical protein